jgi:hypothetical protein
MIASHSAAACLVYFICIENAQTLIIPTLLPPFLTSQILFAASYFNKYVDVNRLEMISGTEASKEQEQQLQFDVLMNTFVETAINLPPVSVCDNLRKELISNGFVECVRGFLLEDAPCQPVSRSFLIISSLYMRPKLTMRCSPAFYHSHRGRPRCIPCRQIS